MQEMPRNDEKINKKENKFLLIIKKTFKSYIWLAVLLFLIDLITKIVAFNSLVPGEVVKIPGLEWILQFRLVFNTGAAWGFGGDSLFGRIILCFLSYAVAIGIIIYLYKKRKTIGTFFKIILMVALAGDVGNLIDRTFSFMPFLNTMYSKGVIDFLDITPLIPRFGIFNFADSCLVVGLILIFIYLIIDMIKDNKNKGNNEEKISGSK